MEGFEKPQEKSILEKLKDRLEYWNSERMAHNLDDTYEKKKMELAGPIGDLGMACLGGIPGKGDVPHNDPYVLETIRKAEEAVESFRKFEREKLGATEDSAYLKETLEDIEAFKDLLV